MSHRLILGEDAAGPEQAPALAGDIGRHAHVVALGERDLLRRHLPLVLEPAQLEAQQLRLGDLRQHLHEPGLLQLEATDGPVEHDPRLGVTHRFVVACHRGSDRPPGDAVARGRETHEGRLEPGRLRQQRLLGDAHVLKHELARVARAQGELPLLVLRREALGVGGDDEPADRARIVQPCRLGPHDRDVRGRAVRDPHLGPVQYPPLLRLLRDRDHPTGVRAVVGLGQPEAADAPPARQLGQPAPLLLVAAEFVDGIHHERSLHRCERAHPGIAALQLLHDQPVGDVIEARAAELLGEVRPEQPQLGHLGNEVGGELARDVVLADHRDDVVVHPGAHRVADGALLFG